MALGRKSGATSFSWADLFDDPFPGHEIAAGIEQHALGFQAVAAGPARFLLVMLDRLGHGGVQDEADVGAVDAHAESDGGHDQVAFLLRRTLLARPAFLGRQAGVIGPALDALGLQDRADVVHVLAAQAIDDARLARVAFEHFVDLGVEIGAAAGRGR